MIIYRKSKINSYDLRGTVAFNKKDAHCRKIVLKANMGCFYVSFLAFFRNTRCIFGIPCSCKKYTRKQAQLNYC